MDASSVSRIIRSTTGFFILSLRKRAGISQEKAGNIIGLSQSQFSKIERGESPIDIDILAILIIGLCRY
jgi:transcriptional regulator with XRE-family HTH domain